MIMNYYCIKQNQKITLPKKANNPAITDLLNNYAYGIKWNIEFTDNENEIIIENGEYVDCIEYDYAINVTEQGVYIRGEGYNAVIRGLMTLIEKIFCYGRLDYKIECGATIEKPKMGFRSVHLCWFPEYSVEKMRKVIRICGVSKYTHVILETWGSIKLDTLKELSWECGFSKEEVKTLIAEANALGMEVIPFFQHLGHASLQRLGYTGKHTVLDQNPELEYLYYPGSYGWVWNFKCDEVRNMLKNVREELMELFGESEYFHLGCDESGMEFDAKELSDYLNEVNAHLNSKGRRAIIWGDMLLSHDFFEDRDYECNSTAEYANNLLENLDKDMVVADWQYNIKTDSWESAKFIRDKGFSVICCPWQENENMNSAVNTVYDDGHFGIMKTTWDKLLVRGGVASIMYFGLASFGDSSLKENQNTYYSVTERVHAAFRKTSPQTTSYEESGWHKNNVEI